MRLALPYLLIVSGALAQPAPPNPLNDTIQAFWTAFNSGQFSDAAAKRAQARSLIEQMPPTAEGFAGQVNTVAQLYQNGGMMAQARDTIQQALTRAGSAVSSADHIMLLNTLADYWERDRNLLRAAAVLEQAVALSEATPSAPANPTRTQADRAVRAGVFSRIGGPYMGMVVDGPGAPFSSSAFLYNHLINIYEQLGRREAIAGLLSKMLAQPYPDYNTIASIYQREGRTDDAAAIYRKMADAAAAKPQHNAWQVASPLQMLANMYASEERYTDAAAVMQQAISAFEASSEPQGRNGAIQSMRENLARYLQQAGKVEEADKIYQDVLDQAGGDPRFQASVANNYAHYLLNSNRGPQAEQYLSSYLSSHPDLDSPQQGMLLFTLSQAARQSGQADKAEEYRRTAMAKQQAQFNQNSMPPTADSLHKAQSAAANGKLDDAFRLASQAIDQTSNPQDYFQLTGQVPSIASMLAARKEPALAERLYQKLFIAAESWQTATIQPLLNVAQNYARFLMQQKERWGDVPNAVERYQTVLTASHSPETGLRSELLRFKIDFARTRGATAEAVAAAKEMLDIEESLNGATGIDYMRAVQTAAGVYEWAGDAPTALTLYQQAVKISDAATPNASWERASARMNAAMAFARQKQFDEAERLANEAVAIGQKMRPNQSNVFTAQLEQIRRMKADPSSIDSATQVPGSIGVIGSFQTGLYAVPATGPLPAPGMAGSMTVGGVLSAAPPPPPPPVKKQ
jgi:tetratricopeptide (TPR) repeat protein